MYINFFLKIYINLLAVSHFQFKLDFNQITVKFLKISIFLTKINFQLKKDAECETQQAFTIINNKNPTRQ